MKSKYSSFIKLFVSVVIVSSASLIQSCSNSEIENLSEQSLQSAVPQNSVFKVYDKTYNTPNGLQIWEAQLNKAIEMDSNMVRNGLKLIHSEYIRQIASITDLETVKTELKKDNSLFIVYKDNSSRFSISKNKEYAPKYSNLIDSLLPTSASMLEAIRSKGDSALLAKAAYVFKKNDLGVVNLVWEYGGKRLNTQCLVSNEKGIIYDKFLFSILITVSETNSIQRNSSKAPQDGYDPTTLWRSVERIYRRGYRVYDFYGNVMNDFGISAGIYGILYNGICYINQAPSVSNWANSVYPDLYNCAAFCRIQSFSPTVGGGDAGHLQFDYGIIGGHNVGISFQGDYPIFTGENNPPTYPITIQNNTFLVESIFETGNATLVASDMN